MDCKFQEKFSLISLLVTFLLSDYTDYDVYCINNNKLVFEQHKYSRKQK